MIGIRDNPADRTMAPALLRTNKCVNHEAIPILYSENVFLVDRAKLLLDWLQRIGPVSIRLLKSLRMFPHAVYSPTGTTWLPNPHSYDANDAGPTWCRLLNKLADEATGLEYVYVSLDAEPDMGHHGAGKDLNFVRALGRIRVSKKMELHGYFATEWPRYLEGKLGMPVWKAEGQREFELRELRKYQRETQNLIP